VNQQAQAILTIQVSSNQTNETQVVAGLKDVGLPAAAVSFPPSQFSATDTLDSNYTDLQAVAFVNAALPLLQNVTIFHTVTVTLLDPVAASQEAQLLLPSQFTAEVNPAQVNTQNVTQITATIISQGTQVLSITGQSQ
jgi:hypothetical protein